MQKIKEKNKTKTKCQNQKKKNHILKKILDTSRSYFANYEDLCMALHWKLGFLLYLLKSFSCISNLFA